MSFSFASPPQFSTPQAQQPSLFSQPTPFPSFQPQPQQQQAFSFQPQQQQQQQLQQQPPPSPHGLLYTKDKAPAGYGTKWEDLHPDSQKFLLQIEERILEYKDESQRLDQCSRLHDSSISSDSFELDANHIMQELGAVSTATERERISVQELMNEVNTMLWNTEVAVRSYMMLRPRFLHSNISATSNIVPAGQAAGASSNSQPATSSLVPVYDFYSGIPKRPSPFMQQTIARFEKNLNECRQLIGELEQLVQMDNDKSSSNSGLASIQSLPDIMSNVHDFFVHVAAKVESLHQYIESMKTAYLADQRRHGDGNDPFLEADRRETAKQEAAARRVHPTLHLPSVAQPSTQGASLFTSSGLAVPSVQQQYGGSSEPSSSNAQSIFSTPSSAAPASTSLFSIPAASTPASTPLFASAGFSPQSTPFGTASTSLFGSVQNTSLIGASTPLAATTPPVGGSSLFSTPSFMTGAALGSGSSFGAVSNKSRQRPRGSRR